MDFQPLVETFGKMEETSSRLALTDHLVALLKETPADLIDKVTYLIQGKLYPDYEGIEMGLAERMALRAIASSSSRSMSEVEAIYRKKGDIGDAAREAMESKGQSTLFSEQMTVERVYCTFDKIAKTTGPGSQETKLRLVASLLNDSTPDEGRYIMKFVMGALRLGIADYTVLDALAIAFTGDKANRKVLENAYNVSSDLGTVAKLLATKGLAAVKAVQITLFKPIRPMLAERVSTAEEAMERMDSRAAIEYKLDGERVQIHKGRDRVELFSRRLEKITDHYPDVSKAAMSLACKEAIMEGEVVAVNLQTGEYLPFQQLMHRRRKHGIEEAMENYPVVINLFDILYLDGKSRTELPYEERRKLLEKTVKGAKDNGIMLKIVPQVVATEPAEIDRFMASAIENGCEGVMVKMPSSTYRAGAREYLWVKLKREYRTELADTLDLVIVGALHGRGRRVGKYGALLLAAYDPKEDIFRSVTKVGTGFTDIHLDQFYRELEKHVIHQKHARVDTGMSMEVWFEPVIVIEVIASEITLSPSHMAAMDAIKEGYGLALRFPKFTGKIRDDKEPEGATTTDEIVTMYRRQLKIHSEAAKSKEQEKKKKESEEGEE
ncbi:ATP-dependent DNA ligase I [Candidatus Nitrososphaera evergladensis SR1]|uniref:DNA ligase n=1 Tax=Candidatus Nitrososphaera evergladensis SR1 TaxID=1459636 RepID=A0A075MSW0_9ARCH|nr:ATP-dependent DNA ligase [Candidatus Nitrososphaera evergladensis]AIF84250.1 ATP-dependent DNA ligase I [Candidatus Nitrososphaera evergladensis SR1]